MNPIVLTQTQLSAGWQALPRTPTALPPTCGGGRAAAGCAGGCVAHGGTRGALAPPSRPVPRSPSHPARYSHTRARAGSRKPCCATRPWALGSHAGDYKLGETLMPDPPAAAAAARSASEAWPGAPPLEQPRPAAPGAPARAAADHHDRRRGKRVDRMASRASTTFSKPAVSLEWDCRASVDRRTSPTRSHKHCAPTASTRRARPIRACCRTTTRARRRGRPRGWRPCAGRRPSAERKWLSSGQSTTMSPPRKSCMQGVAPRPVEGAPGPRRDARAPPRTTLQPCARCPTTTRMRTR